MSVFKKILLFLLLLKCFSSHIVYGQDATFSQYYASALYLNPAFASVKPYITVGVNSRNQWRSIATPYVTNQLSAIVPLYSKGKERNFGGVGLSFYNDRSGDGNLSTTGVNISAAYNVYLAKKHLLAFGVQGGVIQKQINFNNLQWGNQYDPFNGFNSGVSPSITNTVSGRIYPDIGAGLMYYANAGRNIREKGISGFIGLSAYHLNKANESLITTSPSTLPVLYKAHGGVEFTFSDHFNFSPNVLFAMQNNVRQINTGAYLTYMFGDEESKVLPNALIGGAWYRLHDSYIFLLGFGSNVYTVGLSYDYNNSTLRTYTGGKGAYELSLTVQIPQKRAAKTPIKTIIRTPRI